MADENPDVTEEEGGSSKLAFLQTASSKSGRVSVFSGGTDG